MAEEKTVGRRGGLSWLQRRRLGITPLNMARVAKRLKAENEDFDEWSREEIAAAVLNELMNENPTAFADVAAIDWDGLLAFIERLLPVILQIIAPF
jgi:hypothetical protein